MPIATGAIVALSFGALKGLIMFIVLIQDWIDTPGYVKYVVNSIRDVVEQVMKLRDSRIELRNTPLSSHVVEIDEGFAWRGRSGDASPALTTNYSTIWT